MRDFDREVIQRVMIPIGLHLKCEKCAGGELEVVNPNEDQPQVSDTLARFGINVPRYEHRCNNPDCDNMVFLEEVFPRIEYDDFENHFESMG